MPNSRLNARYHALSPSVKNAIKLGLIVVGLCVCWFSFLYLALFLLPITIAVVFAQMLEPIVRLLRKYCKCPRSIAANIAGMLSIVVIGLLGFLLIANVVGQTISFVENLPAMVEEFQPYFLNLYNELVDKINLIDPTVVTSLTSLINSVATSALSGAKTVAFGVLSYASLLPRGIIFVVIMFVSLLLLLRERDNISKYFRTQFPAQWVNKIVSVRGDLIFALLGYLKAQVILMVIVFTMLYLGLSFMKFKYALIFALVIATFDALPVFGAGLFLIPSSIISFVIGDIPLGIGFALLYILTIIFRQTIEPRLVSSHIGVNPLITIAAMYAGLQISGIIGLILGPVTVLVLKNIILTILNGKNLQEYLSYDSQAASDLDETDDQLNGIDARDSGEAPATPSVPKNEKQMK